MDIKQITSANPPRSLFHYTTQEGLLRIIGDKEIWATKAHYLNDSKEFMHAIDLLNEVIDERKYSKRSAVKELRKRINTIENVNVCVASFTKNGDLLSQWRGYGAGGAGYSLGISGARLKKLANAQKFILCPVVYDKDQQVSLVNEIIDRWENGDHHVDGLTPLLDDKPAFEDYFAMFAPILKDVSFSEEQEWRIISPILDCDLERYGFRAGKYSLLPYYRFSLEEPSIKFGLTKVVVGPGPMQDLSKNAVESYLVSKDLKWDIVELSTIPYRGW